MSEDCITAYKVKVVKHEKDLISLQALKVEIGINVYGPWKLTRPNEESYSETMEGL